MKPSLVPSYRHAGVLSNEELGLGGLLKWIRATEDFRADRTVGRSVLELGYFAQVIDLGGGLGLALTTDGVGTKVLIAQMLDRYDTIGIDCVAMNVNDLICVGAEPVSMLDYIATEQAEPAMLEAIAKGLHDGARQAGINVVGGEISQLGEIVRGVKAKSGLDLVGMCVGVVPLDRVNVGQEVRPGDAIVGFHSSGIHCNGLTLARKVLFDMAKLQPTSSLSELGSKTVGEELLRPTRIYVRAILAMLERKLPIKALVNITSDGFLNLQRIRPAVGFDITSLPDPPPIFNCIQELGRIHDAEMFYVFNMGIGFCVILPPDTQVIDAVRGIARDHDVATDVIGEVTDDRDRTVRIPQRSLVSEGDHFVAT